MMLRPVVIFALLLGLIACKDDDAKKEANNKNDSQGMDAFFKAAVTSYSLTDTALLKEGDTASLPAASVTPLIADSIKNKHLGKGTSVNYSPLAKMVQKDKETYYVVKASAGKKAAALLLVYNADKTFAASYPFLLPDADPTTSQTSTIDKNFTITKSIVRREGGEAVGEGKDVVAYEPATKSFGLILQDPLNDKSAVAVNPIDTFPKKHPLTGDYYLNKKNLVAVRDGRYPNQLLVFIHTENESGDCTGQLKGEFILTSSTTAAYRQGGDPCVLNLTFKGNTVSMAEQTGCGNYRELDCPLTGTFTRKKPQSAKPAPAKPKRK